MPLTYVERSESEEEEEGAAAVRRRLSEQSRIPYEDEDEEDWPGAGGRLQAPTRVRKGQISKKRIPI